MTREEEIIEMLKVLKEQALSSCNDTAVIDVKKDSFIFVIDMAIKALGQEPCEDCISRAEAIKALEYNLSVEADGGLDKYRTVIKDLLNAIYNTQKKAIEDLPSIQPINQNIKALGEELRTFRGGIKDEKVLTGFNMAIALCNKHLADMGGTE